MKARDTIVAVATPPGKGGVGVVRISGTLVPQIAADSSSESIDFAVPGSPTSSRPRSPASVTTHRSTSARSPTNFASMTRLPLAPATLRPSLPAMNVTTARGVSAQPGGRGPLSEPARNASSSA